MCSQPCCRQAKGATIKLMEYTTPEGTPTRLQRRRGLIISVATIFLLTLAVLGGWYYLNFARSPLPPPGPTVEEQNAGRRAAQQRLLVSPEQLNLTPEAYAAEVAQLAVESDTITMSADCSMDPLIIKMKEDSVLKIDNRDSVEHVLAFEDQNFFAVSSGRTRDINITEVFQKGEGIYRYRCGDRSQEIAVGIMYVVK